MKREKELFKNTAILTIGKLCTQAVNFVLLPVYTNILEPEEYGIANLFSTYVVLVAPIVCMMLEQGLFRFLLNIRDDKKKSSSFFTTTFVLNIIEIILFVILFSVFSLFIHFEYKMYFIINIAVYILMNTMMQFSRGIGNMRAYAEASFISAVVSLLSNIITVFGLGIKVQGLLISMILGQFAAFLFLFFRLRTWQYFDIKLVSKNIAIELIKYSVPFIPNQLSWWAIGASDKTIVSNLISVAANGIYSVASKFSNIVVTFNNLLNLSWTENISLHIDDGDFEEYITKATNVLFSIIFDACICLISALSLIFPLIISSNYSEAYNQIPILVVSVLFQVFIGLYSAVYVALKKSKELAKTSVLSAVINIAVDLALIKFIGLYAASISTLISFATMAIYRYIDIKKYYNIELMHKIRYFIVTAIVVVIYYVNWFPLNVAGFISVIGFILITNKDGISFVWASLKKVIKR